MKKVAVPVRPENHRIGEAMIVATRTCSKSVGGSRVIYNQEML